MCGTKDDLKSYRNLPNSSRWLSVVPVPVVTARVRSTTGGYVFTLSTICGRGGGGVPHPANQGGPLPRSGQGVPHPADGGGGGTPFPGLDGGYPIQLMGGTPPPPQHVLATRRVECLLRSRRRTFLLSLSSFILALYTVPVSGGSIIGFGKSTAHCMEKCRNILIHLRCFFMIMCY